MSTKKKCQKNTNVNQKQMSTKTKCQAKTNEDIDMKWCVSETTVCAWSCVKEIIVLTLIIAEKIKLL